MPENTIANRLPIKKSVATTLFRRFFLIYFSVALCLTVIQMAIEYNHVKREILREIEQIVANIEPSLAQHIWDVNSQQLLSVIQVLQKLPIVTDIELSDERNRPLITVHSNQAPQTDAADTASNSSRLETNRLPYRFEFDIIYRERDILVGKGIIQFGIDVVLNRVKYGFYLIILNSMLKTTALLVVFLIVSHYILAKPLAELIGAIKAIRFDNLEQVTARIRSKGNDEFKLIEKTLNEMIRKLNGARHKLEENAAELQEKNEKLEQTDRLKDEFLANTSHELRTPLHGIIGIAQTLSMNLEQQPTGTIQSNLDIIVSTGRHLSMLVDDILDFSKLKHNSLNLVLQAVDLYQVVTVVEKLSQSLLTLKGLQFENRLPLNLPYVSADEIRLQQILQNLIGNAIKFSEQGVITIEARQQGDWLEIAVSDSAQLIPPDKFGIIFQAFEQLDGSLSRTHGGTGLGLSIVKQLVELHHGTVWVSNHSSGNTFTFTLPVVMGTETTHISPPPIDSAEPIRQPCTLLTGTASQDNAVFTILAVDDDIANLQVIINQLSSENYAVHCVQEGQEALNWIARNGRPDLVLLDIMMPRMSGFEVCKQLRQQFDIGSLPIVFLTASHRRKDRETGFSLGANDYLTKPFEKSDLLARVRVHIRLLLAKKQIQTMRNCANRIAEFKNHEQMLIFATDQMASTRLVSEGVVFKETTILRAPEKKYDFLSQLPDLSILQPYLSETDEQIIIINSIKPEEPIQRYFIQHCGIDLQGAHLAYLQPNGSRENTICLFRTNDRMPFSELDREYMLNMLDQLQIIENNIQTMLSDELVAVLPEIQPNLARITHITAASPYCSVFLENEPIAREVRITLSSLDLYFRDELLLRIHRSHLINPHKLIGIQKRLVGNRKYKYDAVVGYKDRPFSLRIGDNYLTKMKRHFSRFFPAE